MFERLEALETAVRQIQAWLRGAPEQDGHKFGQLAEPPAPSMDDPEKAKLAYEAAQAEVKNQQERGKLNLEAAQANEKRAKETLDKSVADAKARDEAEAKRQQEMAQHQQAAQRVTAEPSDARRK